MKITRKILAMILALSMLVSMPIFALQFPDVAEDNAHEEAINVLSSLGIIKGYEDGQFKPDKDVSRAELTSLLMRMLNLSITGITVADSGYIDVASNHWAVYDIKTASTMGIIKGFGDGIFMPEASVTFEQAVKMIVAMLGYENLAVTKGGWPNGYMAQGRELGLLKKAEMTQTDPAPRKIIAQLLYNALPIDLMEQTTTSTPEAPAYEILKNKNVMTEYMKIEKVEGVVSANPYSTLTYEESSVLDDEIEIDSSTGKSRYKIGAFSEAFDYLGLDVVAYVKYDENFVNREILHIMTKGEVKEVVIPAADISSFVSTKIVVENPDSEKEITYKLDPSKVKILYNGKYLDRSYAASNNLLIPKIGTVTLVDSGAGYNLIKIDSYKNYLVKSVDTSEYNIYVDNTIDSNNTTKISVPLDDVFGYNITIKKGGSPIQLSSINKGNIISVKSNIEGVQTGIMNLEILVSDAKKSGKITETDGEYFTIGTASYRIAPSLIGNEIADKIVYKASGTFYLDVFGEIAYAEFAAGETYKYGYVLRAIQTIKAGETTGAVKIYDYSLKGFKSYNFADSIVIDGTKYTDHELAVQALKDVADFELEDRAENENIVGSQPIKYLLNNSNKISEINTVNNDNNDDASFVASKYADDAEYVSSNRYFKTGSGNISIDTKTVVFSIPNDREEESKYSIKTYSFFKNNAVYDIEVVETSSSGVASVVIVYESNIDADVHYQSPMFVISEFKDINDDGLVRTKLIGYDFKTGSSAEYYIEDKEYVSTFNLEKGDMIRFGLNTDGEINDKIYKYLDVSEASIGNHPHNPAYDIDDMRDTSNYPLRKVGMTSNLTTVYGSLNITSNIANRYAFIYGTPLKTITDDSNTLIFTDLVFDVDDGSVVGETGFNGVDTEQAITLSIPNNTTFFVYDEAELGNNRLKVLPSSSTDGKESAIYNLKTYDIAEEDCDNVFIYAIEENLKVVYIIK